MNPIQKTSTAPPVSRRDCLFTLGAIAATLSGCGGGGGSVAGVSSGGTGSFSAGTITGFGSVFINGVKYEDSAATFTDDEGGSRTRDELQLGMVAVVDGSSVSAGNPSATTVTFSEQVVGRVTALTNAGGVRSFVVFDLVIEVTGSTIFEPRTVGLGGGLTNGFASLAVGDVVEVHGFPTPTGFQATRIHREDPNERVYRLQGVVKDHVVAVGGGSFKIGTLAIQYTATPGSTEVRFTPVDGALVRVRLRAETPAPTTWTATRIARPENALPDRSEAQVKGTITSFTSPAQFSVNGIPVNAADATVPAGLAPGARVEVKGRLQTGVLVATAVTLEDQATINALRYELRGTIGGVTSTTFVLRGVTIDFSATPPTAFVNGNAARLATYTGPTDILEVQGVANTSGTQINATHIRFQT